MLYRELQQKSRPMYSVQQYTHVVEDYDALQQQNQLFTTIAVIMRVGLLSVVYTAVVQYNRT